MNKEYNTISPDLAMLVIASEAVYAAHHYKFYDEGFNNHKKRINRSLGESITRFPGLQRKIVEFHVVTANRNMMAILS